MEQTEQNLTVLKPYYKSGPFYLLLLLIAVLIGLYFYSQALIQVEKHNPDLGEKVIVTLPAGKTILTYENLIVEEDGKLLYKGENSTLDLTGGVVVYQEWE
ncbi:hypothetical protein R4Z10_14510 [Niallia sp. XMNu-256]|uniref:hypothetical protein n=1 Tax=Niallia sp. XMNu-256 TaxID=3082444 RepID=UPI0030D54A5C